MALLTVKTGGWRKDETERPSYAREVKPEREKEARRPRERRTF